MLHRKKLRSALLFAPVLALPWMAPAPVQAATATSTMAVTATVLSFCTIVAAPLVFGNYASTTLDASTIVAVTCSISTPFNIGLNAGSGPGATTVTRKMVNGLDALTYSLYSDAGRSTVVGNTVGTDTVAGTGTGLLQNFTIYGRIPAGQYVTPGVYTDLITATITY